MKSKSFGFPAMIICSVGSGATSVKLVFVSSSKYCRLPLSTNLVSRGVNLDKLFKQYHQQHLSFSYSLRCKIYLKFDESAMIWFPDIYAAFQFVSSFWKIFHIGELPLLPCQ